MINLALKELVHVPMEHTEMLLITASHVNKIKDVKLAPMPQLAYLAMETLYYRVENAFVDKIKFNYLMVFVPLVHHNVILVKQLLLLVFN